MLIVFFSVFVELFIKYPESTTGLVSSLIVYCFCDISNIVGCHSLYVNYHNGIAMQLHTTITVTAFVILSFI